ncbi:MAG: enoyl-CoA hydratase-related protein [Candidatus Andeanibacterium colombiense]|uniref:Enoyl-CoA hydratase-related protein n=1 Tax=Candidatus Andeanibacterium colombiense TaxID=3121345 RepID=A0AAJ6BP38_9SPHN|nr:MAG: enoyl-CoA hydratase-related protein [Sphingomonadaceae bacterium]
METPDNDSVDLLVERRGGVLWLTINREARRNAISAALIEQMHRALREAQADSSLRAIVLTGAGDKAFCAGADLGRGTQAFRDEDETTTDFGRMARTVRELGVPLIARVNGACVAGGMGLMGICDLAVASNNARFGLPEVKVGVFPMQVLVHLRGVIGSRLVSELCITGDLIDAHRALEIGLVNRVVPFAELDQEVEKLLGSIRKASPAAVRSGKRAMAAMQNMAFDEAMPFAEAQINLISRTSGAAEGIAAFNERRPAKWAEDEQ